MLLTKVSIISVLYINSIIHPINRVSRRPFISLVFNVTSTQIGYLWQAARGVNLAQEKQTENDKTMHTFSCTITYKSFRNPNWNVNTSLLTNYINTCFIVMFAHERHKARCHTPSSPLTHSHSMIDTKADYCKHVIIFSYRTCIINKRQSIQLCPQHAQQTVTEFV